MKEITQAEINQANDWVGYLSLKPNFVTSALRMCDAKLTGVFGGNRLGKTKDNIGDYIDRILGRHPIEWKNIRPNDSVRIFRFCAPKLPLEKEGEEITSPVYRALKFGLPNSLIKKDITVRRPVMTIKDIQGGSDIYAEFVSYGQEIDTQAGVPRKSVYIDEHCDQAFFEEQWPRVLCVNADGSNGDICIGLTPVEYISWEFEKIYEKADTYYNSPHYRAYIKESRGEILKPIQRIGSQNNIAVIRAATDDNPTMRKEEIDELMNQFDDIDTYEIRRYGIFHAISGKVLKDFDPFIHQISKAKYFPNGVPFEWIHGRGIDFHEHTNWACPWIALSPENEAFVYQEYNPSPDRLVSLEIAREIATRSGDYRYNVNLVDPRMAIRQANTGLTTLDDFNRYFHEFRKSGLGTGGYWQTWDTKNERGRDIVKERLKNSRLVGKPFCNHGLPTLWVLDNCPETIYSFKNWKWEEWGNRRAMLSKEEKNKAEDKYSHFPIAIECLFKHPSFSSLRFRGSVVPQRPSPYRSMRERF